jgi:WD40 repeat protein
MVTSIVLGEVAGDPVAMSGSLDGELRVWNLTTGEQRGEPLTGHTGAVTSIAISQLASATVAISSSSDWTVRVWDLATGEQISWPAGDRGPAGSALALGRIGDVRIVMTDGRWPVGVWNAVNGTPIDDLQSPHGAVTAVTYAELDGAPVAVSGHRDGAMRVWDLSVLVAGELLDEPLIGEVLAAHPDRVTSLAASEVAGAPVIVSSGLDGSILVWRLR